ncbi:hypothetical protein ACH4FX_20220 [Streptomyces sp. NPDC018019]
MSRPVRSLWADRPGYAAWVRVLMEWRRKALFLLEGCRWVVSLQDSG